MTSTSANALASEALKNSSRAVFWSDSPDAPPTLPTQTGAQAVDLVIIGGGFTGLWAAVQALEDNPGLDVVILEAKDCGYGASSRNGGFCEASLTHGFHNGLSHWPDEIDTLQRLGNENLDGIEETLARYNISADFQRTGELSVATEQWQLDELHEGAADYRAAGETIDILDAEGVKKLVNSPTYVGGAHRPDGTALVNPAQLVWGLRAAAESLGAKIYNNSPAVDVQIDGSGLAIFTPHGTVHCDRAISATNAYPGPIKRISNWVIPVYDHVLMTEPLSSEQMASIGWQGRQGVGDAANQFHYYRLTQDNRILWGGYDATYHFNNSVSERHEDSPETHRKIAGHFFETFPQLEDLTFTHRWGGPIATTTKFTATWGTSHEKRLTWVAGYTGLGVGASRFGARVALDLSFGEQNERTELAMVRKKPMPFPPEPIRSLGVAITKRSIQASDANNGARNAWLKLLDRFGVGFDS